MISSTTSVGYCFQGEDRDADPKIAIDKGLHEFALCGNDFALRRLLIEHYEMKQEIIKSTGGEMCSSCKFKLSELTRIQDEAKSEQGCGNAQNHSWGESSTVE